MKLTKSQKQKLNIPIPTVDNCPICKSDDLIDIDDYYTKCRKCGFSFVG